MEKENSKEITISNNQLGELKIEKIELKKKTKFTNAY
jgi:hypothetical protein